MIGVVVREWLSVVLKSMFGQDVRLLFSSLILIGERKGLTMGVGLHCPISGRG